MKEITLRALFRDTDAYAGQEVLIKGWVRNNRNSNKFGFIELNDGCHRRTGADTEREAAI